MSGRKELMKRIVEGGAALPSDPTGWQGEMTIATRHTVYRFRDGLCVAVHRQDTGAVQNECVGMHMTGWLVEGADGPRVSGDWLPGASAVLMRQGRHGDAIALTSPTIQVRRDAPRSSRTPRPPSYHDAQDSMTRIGVPRAR
jgi:hypothetical protein